MGRRDIVGVGGTWLIDCRYECVRGKSRLLLGRFGELVWFLEVVAVDMLVSRKIGWVECNTSL